MSDNLPPIPQGYRMKVKATGDTKRKAWENLLAVICEACTSKQDRNQGEWPDWIEMNEGRIEAEKVPTLPSEPPTPDVKPMGAVTICRNGYIEDLERDLAAVSAQRDALALDAARLDFLQANHLTAWRVSHDEWEPSTTGIPGCGTRKEVFDGWVVREGDEPNMDIRATIDAAMERGVR